MFLDIETTTKIKLGSNLEQLTQRHNRREQANLDDCENENCASTHFLQIHKNQFIDLQESLERYCNVIPVFGFSSAKNDLNLIKAFLLPILIDERDIEPTVIKKANHFISFNFGDIHLLDILNFLGGATSLDTFLKAYKTSETKRFFTYEWFDHPDKTQNTEHSPYDALYNKVRTCNPLEADCFYHEKDIDMLKPVCTLPSLAFICLHKSTDAKFYPFMERDKDLLEKNREDVVGGPPIVFTRKTVVEETFIRKSANLCKSTVGIDAIQLYPCSMCQSMPTGLYTRWDFDSETSRFIPRQNKTLSFENIIMSHLQRTRPECKTESFLTTGRQKKIDCVSVDGFCSHCNTVFEAIGCFYHFCPCQELRPSLTEEEIQRGSKKRELDALRRHYIHEKGFKVFELWECKWWRLYKTTNTVKQHIREHFPYRRSLAAEQLLKEIKKGKLFGYVQCDIEVPENLRANFANFPPIFKNT